MVPRETLIADGARDLGITLGATQLARLVGLAELLMDHAIPRGFLAAGERERIVPRHILESLALTRWLPDEDVGFDVGSGAGLPGLVLACVRPGPMVLVEAQARRAAFLRESAYLLGLSAEIVRDRAENVCRSARRGCGRAVTARALAPPAETLELTMPLAATGGIVAVLVGRIQGPELSAAGAAADVLGGTAPRLERFEVPGVSEQRWVMIVQKLRSTPDRYPRPPGPRRRRPAGVDVV